MRFRITSLLAVIVLSVSTVALSVSKAEAAYEVTVTHLAGSGGAGSLDGVASTAKFISPRDVIFDDGFYYAVDRNGIRRISPSGEVKTIFTFQNAPLSTVYCSINIDKKDVIWVAACDARAVLRISKSGEQLSNIPVSDSNGWIGNNHSTGFLPDGRLLLPIWYRGKIVAVNESGTVTTFFSNGQELLCGGASATRTENTYCPYSLAVADNGEVIFGNSSLRSGIFKVNSSTSATQIATSSPVGLRYRNGSFHYSVLIGAEEARRRAFYRINSSGNTNEFMSIPTHLRWIDSGFDLDPNGNVGVGTSSAHSISIYQSNGQLIVKSGNADLGRQNGAAKQATFNRPSGLAEDSSGNLYIREYGAIRRLGTDGQVSTFYSSESINNDSAIFLREGRLYFIDSSNYLVSIDISTRQFRSESLIAVRPEYLSYSANNFAFDSKGNAYVIVIKNSDGTGRTIRKILPNGSRQDLTSIIMEGNSNSTIFIDRNDRLWVGHNGAIRPYDSNGALVTVAGPSGYLGSETVLVQDAKGDIYQFSTDFRTSILTKYQDATTNMLISGSYYGSENLESKSSFNSVRSMIFTRNGDLAIADTDNNVIRKVVIREQEEKPTIQKRVPRDINQVPRPAELQLGLSQTTFNKYFDDNLSAFTESPADARIVESLPIWDDNARANKSYEWTGYFIPDSSGRWSFRLSSDDAAYLWLGANAVSAFRSNPLSGIVTLPGKHAVETKSGVVSLVKDQVYPIRINYGNWENSAAIFKVEFQAPGFTQWENDFRGLLWHSPPGNCTNWGISYVLVNTLGIEKINPPAGCTSNAGANVTSKNKPTTPSFSAVNFTGNKINISVNIGSAASSRPEKIYLVAPKLGITAANPLAGRISGSSATWSIDFDKLLSGTMIPLEIVGEREGVKSDPLVGSYQAPALSNPITKVPAAPTNFKQRVVGNAILVTVESKLTPNALASDAYLFGKSLGISKQNAISGEVLASKVVFEVPIKASMAGKRFPVTIYLENDRGESKPLNVTLAVPAAPKPVLPTAIPRPAPTTQTVLCTRATQSRAFAGTKCPPGWEEK